MGEGSMSLAGLSALRTLLLLLILLPVLCKGICVENGERPVRRLNLNCTGSPFASFCCSSPSEAVNSSSCLPRPWRHNACHGGYYAGADNATLPCPDGFFCPENALCMVRCSVGAYCKQHVAVQNETGQCSATNSETCCQPYAGSERWVQVSAMSSPCPRQPHVQDEVTT